MFWYVKYKHDMDPNSNINYRRKIPPLLVHVIPDGASSNQMGTSIYGGHTMPLTAWNRVNVVSFVCKI